VRREQSGRASAAEKVSGMHNTAGRKTRELAAYGATTHRAFKSDTDIPSLGHGRPTFYDKELAVSRDASGRITVSTVHPITCHEGTRKE
jgi:hypothetical protein